MAREALYARLDARIERMLADGFLEEVRGLLAAGFGPDLPAMHGIGYRHLIPVLTRGASLADAVRAMKRDTRRYAKRQWTWFGAEPMVAWVTVDAEVPESVVADVEKILERSQAFG
jgi:tRNA dimethylallyltransferase